jgi:hypothetical protein
LRGGGLTEEWWAGLGHALEQCERERAGEEVDPPEGVNRETDEPTWTDVAIAWARLSRKIDRENKGLAGFYLREYAGILGPEISIDILRDHFGPAILKRHLAKKRGQPTAVQRHDDRRICVYVNAIMLVTGDSMRSACKSLAKMRLKVTKDAASGRTWVVLDNAETIRKRHFRAADPPFARTDAMHLLYAWHGSGEPPFLNWLKALIAKGAIGPI